MKQVDLKNKGGCRDDKKYEKEREQGLVRK